MINPTWALLWIALFAIPRAGPEEKVKVIAQELEVFDAPEDGAFATVTLKRGDSLVILGEADEGWLAIEPPEGSFDWIDRASIDVDDDDDRLGVVRADRTRIRAGRIDARMPGPPRALLAKGTKVRLLDQPPLILRQGTGRRAWLAIASRPSERRYIRAEGIGERPSAAGRAIDDDSDDLAPRRIDRPMDRLPVAIPKIDARLLAVAPEARELGLSEALASEIRAIETRHRRALREPIDRWDLEPIRADYQALLDHESDPRGQAALRDRLARVARQTRAARSILTVESLLEKSRGLDQAAAASRGRDAELLDPTVEPFDADGILQASSYQVDGRRVWALIGRNGEVSYLDIPPGLDMRKDLDRRVGVRGSITYDDRLRARLIRVRDLELLGRASLSPR